MALPALGTRFFGKGFEAMMEDAGAEKDAAFGTGGAAAAPGCTYEASSGVVELEVSCCSAVSATFGAMMKQNMWVPEHGAQRREGREQNGLSQNGYGNNLNKDRPEGRHFEGPKAPQSKRPTGRSHPTTWNDDERQR